MLRRLWISVQRDTYINWRNGYYLVTILIALIYLVTIRWIIPADTSAEPHLYIVDDTRDQRFARFAVQEDSAGRVQTLSNVDELQARMGKDESSVGISLAEEQPLPRVTLYFQAHHNPRVRELTAISIHSQLQALYQGQPTQAAPIIQRVLRGDVLDRRVPYNLSWVPILIFGDATMIAMILVAVLIFMEKDEGTLKAYLVTPGRVWEYLLSKALSLTVLGVLCTLIVVPFTVGGGANYLHLIAIVFAGCLFGSLLGALFGVHFDNISQFFFPVVLLFVLSTLPGVAYFVPSFSPWWLRWHPTYPLVFGLREAIFPSGNPQIVGSALLTLLGLDVILLIASSAAFQRHMARR
jgi:hypothetical protein